MTTILIPAIDSLPLDSRTRLNNASHTCLSIGVLPTYVWIYGEDVEELDVHFDVTPHTHPWMHNYHVTSSATYYSRVGSWVHSLLAWRSST